MKERGLRYPIINQIPEKLTAALEADKNKLNELGCEAKLLFIDDAESAYDVVKHSLVEVPATPFW